MERILTTHRYIGTSSEVKPASGTDTAIPEGSTIPAGSTFHEHDTGRDFVFDGTHWLPSGQSSESSEPVLHAILVELRAIRELHEAIAANL